jgi:hypothetical protein
MADEKARIVAELTGGSAVASEAAKIDKALTGVGGVARTVGGAVAGMAAETLRAVGVMQTINIANAVEQAKQLDLATARLGQSAGGQRYGAEKHLRRCRVQNPRIVVGDDAVCDGAWSCHL